MSRVSLEDSRAKPFPTSHYHNQLFFFFLSFSATHPPCNTICKGKSMITKKSDGSQVKEKESTDSSTTIEDDDVKGKSRATHAGRILKTMIKFSDDERKLIQLNAKILFLVVFRRFSYLVAASCICSGRGVLERPPSSCDDNRPKSFNHSAYR